VGLRHQGLIDDYYLPLFFFLYKQVTAAPATPFFAGINAPQGAGKSMLAGHLVRLFAWCDLKAVTLSIDDFYLTYKQQIHIAGENPENTFLQQRGYPGTHDIALGVEILSRLKDPQADPAISLPRYDKSKYQGQGDRIDKDLWPSMQLPVDVVILEGWMLGFQPLPEDHVPDAQLHKINALLQDYEHWDRFLDCFVYIHPEDPGFVVEWRCEAEERMKATGVTGMSLTEVRRYAEKFLPAYKLYGPHLLECLPPVSSFLKIEIGRNRLPLSRS